MSTPLTIVAHIQAVQGQGDFVKKELLKLIEPTLKEKGCIQYDLQNENNNPEQFLFFEIWENRELWQDHMQTPHILEFIDTIEDYLENFSVQEMTKIS
ncbi:antibiotic biosynthesis monooxygenase [Sulfurimonas sp. MAG313]|nr:putative quinol monooxygenase [Sulfurimonas sp. MAG313]MDF1880124.1 antibiotic biosynthesis monooxygenase [Sulfurimonas sp. MAG313]